MTLCPSTVYVQARRVSRRAFIMVDSDRVRNFLLHIVEEYYKSVEDHFKNEASKLASGPPRRGPQQKTMFKYSYTPLAKTLFDPIEAKELPDLFISLFDNCDAFMAERNWKYIGPPSEPQSFTDIKELILKMIIPYQLPQWVKPPEPKEKDKDPKKKKKAARSVCVPPRAQFTIEHSMQLMAKCLPIPLSIESKMWKQIRYILVPDNKKEKYEKLAKVVAEATAAGTISFCALTYCMQDPVMSADLPPEAILQAIYLGPLKACAVEFFASGRSQEYRRMCRDVIGVAEKATKNVRNHQEFRPANLPENHPELCSHTDFVYNTTLLINDLKGLRKGFSVIANGWACAAFKKFGKRTYEDKTWREENLYDLIWTILVQRPHLKKFICDALEREYHDYGASKYWRRMQPGQMDRVNIRNRNETEMEVLIVSVEFLNFDSSVKKISFVNTSSELNRLSEMILKEVSENGTVVVGLDAEWSAFTGESKASILQIALRTEVFIVDLEAPVTLPHAELRGFFSMLFLNKNIIKLGFQFSEDLLQLRNAIHHCRALHQPDSLYCVGRLVVDLLEMTEKLENSNEILEEIVPHLRNPRLDESQESIVLDKTTDAATIEAAEADQPEQAELTAETETESAVNRTMNKGLSYLCEQILGRPLDKTEQCSVWDRRPLRNLQTRYAAMDAYCMIMIYDVCARWAIRLNTTIDDVMKKQSQIRVSLPLFSDDCL